MERNLDCIFDRFCLGYAAVKRQPALDCGRCPFKNIRPENHSNDPVGIPSKREFENYLKLLAAIFQPEAYEVYLRERHFLQD